MKELLIPIEKPKLVQLIKLLYEGSLPLSKVKIKLNHKQPKILVDDINFTLAKVISSIRDDSLGDWLRAELKCLIWFQFDGRKKEIIKLDDNVEIAGFYPDSRNPTTVTLRICKQPGKVQNSTPQPTRQGAITL